MFFVSFGKLHSHLHHTHSTYFRATLFRRDGYGAHIYCLFVWYLNFNKQYKKNTLLSLFDCKFSMLFPLFGCSD